MNLAIFAARAWTSCNHLAFHRLLLRRVGNDDAARGLFLGLDAPDQHAVVQWTECHEYLLGLDSEFRN